MGAAATAQQAARKAAAMGLAREGIAEASPGLL
jgi:hypothetical protein